MHFLIAWEATGPQSDLLRERLKKALVGESFAEAWRDVHVIRVESNADRQAVLDRLLEIARENSEYVNLIATPTLQDGTGYGGWLTRGRWREIGRRALWQAVRDDEEDDDE